jgi:hypothetical protein
LSKVADDWTAAEAVEVAVDLCSKFERAANVSGPYRLQTLPDMLIDTLLDIWRHHQLFAHCRNQKIWWYVQQHRKVKTGKVMNLVTASLLKAICIWPWSIKSVYEGLYPKEDFQMVSRIELSLDCFLIVLLFVGWRGFIKKGENEWKNLSSNEQVFIDRVRSNPQH